MSEDVYAKSDMTKKMTFKREEGEEKIEDIYEDMQKSVTFKREEKEERIVDIHVSADSLTCPDPGSNILDAIPEDTTVDQHPDVSIISVSPARIFSRVAAVCLGLLCVLLLAGIIVLGVNYTRVNEDKSRLQTQYDNMNRERDVLQRRFCESIDGWTRFGFSCYYASDEHKTWNEGRDDCRKRGADLVIINSKEEQEFLFTFERNTWIGLTDRHVEDTWTWVDETRLTTPKFWAKGEPNNDVGGSMEGEDCVEIYIDRTEGLNNWIDRGCDKQNYWICERGI